MRNVLYVTASLMGDNSKSRQVANELIESFRAASPVLNVVERHLTTDNSPHLSLATLGAIGAPADKRDAAQTELAKYADTVIEQVEAADTVIIAAPMYNFTVPTHLKAWLDHLARAGRTFKYTGVGTVDGQLKGKKVIVVQSRGGFYEGNSPMDFQEPYLKAFFGFLGVTDVSFIRVEGQNVSPEAAAKGLQTARASLGQLVPLALAA